jgi:AraC-like DNA-binding protein
MADFLGVRFHYDNSFLSSPIKLKNFRLVQIGEMCLEAGFDVPTHKQPCNEISYIFSGRGVFEHNGIKTEVTAGDIIITPAVSTHAIYSSDNEPIYYAYTGFNFGDESLPQSITDFFRTDKQITFKDRVGIYDYFKHCMDEFYRSGEPDLLLIESYLLQIVLLTARSGESVTQTYDYLSTTESPGRLIYLIMKYVERNIEKPITVGGIAESLGYSTYHISHLFKAKMNITLKDYIANEKVNAAKRLIKRNRYTLTEISDKLGYISIQSFSRSFKNKTGISPTQYVANLK